MIISKKCPRSPSAEALEFERAAALRDRIQQMRSQMGKPLSEAKIEHATRDRRGPAGKAAKGAPGAPDRKPSGAAGQIPRPKRSV